MVGECGDRVWGLEGDKEVDAACDQSEIKLASMTWSARSLKLRMLNIRRMICSANEVPKSVEGLLIRLEILMLKPPKQQRQFSGIQAEPL